MFGYQNWDFAVSITERLVIEVLHTVLRTDGTPSIPENFQETTGIYWTCSRIFVREENMVSPVGAYIVHVFYILIRILDTRIKI